MTAIHGLDWLQIEAQLGGEGWAVLPGILSDDQVAELAQLCPAASTPLPHVPWLAELRRHLYAHVAPVANRWNGTLSEAHTWPDALGALPAQSQGLSRLTRLRAGEDEALHQYGDTPHAFPLQLVALLSEPGQDFTGGEFVMTEQRPRMQSRPMVLPLRRGDVAVITVARRPHQGSKGSYRVNLKHAVSRVRSGERLGLELLFDDAWPG